jgi:hypothetical protein
VLTSAGIVNAARWNRERHESALPRGAPVRDGTSDTAWPEGDGEAGRQDRRRLRVGPVGDPEVAAMRARRVILLLPDGSLVDATPDEIGDARRYAATAATWFEKAVVRLAYVHGRATGERRWAVGYHGGQLLSAALRDANGLVPLLDDDANADALERAEALVERLKRYRLAAKLEKTEGRTEAEAEAFRAKAASLREER